MPEGLQDAAAEIAGAMREGQLPPHDQRQYGAERDCAAVLSDGHAACDCSRSAAAAISAQKADLDLTIAWAVKHYPQEAAFALQDLGYTVIPPGAPEAPQR